MILVGAWALSQGVGEPARALEFNAGGDPFALVVSGAALAFFAIIGFEDSVNMVEETTNPQRDFPRAFFIGITITGVVYMLVAFFTTALVPIDVLRETDRDLLEVVRAGAPWFPLVLFSFIAMVAVSNTSLINLMMASRLLYGMSNERAIPRMFGAVHERRRTPWVAIISRRSIALLARELERRPHARRHDGAAAACVCSRSSTSPCSCCGDTKSSTRTIGRRRCAPCSASYRASIWRCRSPAATPRNTRSRACCCCSGSRYSRSIIS